MKKLVSLIALISLGVVGFAQDYYQTIRNELEPIFANLDKSRVPTGYLGDYAIEEIDLSMFDGLSITDSNYVSKNDYDRILRTFESTKVNSMASFNADDIIDGIIAYNDSLYVPISFIACKYNYIRHDAINIGAIECSNGNLYDVFDAAGNWQNPYLEKKLFAFVPYAGRATSSTVSFVINGNFFTNLNITGIEFDCGDGSGYRAVSGTGPITGNYSDSGHKELKLRISLSSGEQLLAHSDFIVEIPSNINYVSEVLEEPDAEIDYFVTNEYDGGTVSATASIHYSNSPMCKPLIVVEGYDPVGLIACWEKEGTTEHENGYSNFGRTYDNFSQTVKANYDIVHIDFHNSNADIRANAKLLESILTGINQLKPVGADDNVIIGESMGGLIARYALCDMERNHISHNCRMYISLDSPHLGANIPLGALYAAMDVAFSTNLLDPFVFTTLNKRFELDIQNPRSFGDKVKECLRGSSVKQMLVNYVNENGILDNSVHVAWQNELNEIGFPQGDLGSSITNIGISNGGLNTNPNDTLFHIDAFGKTKFWGEVVLFIIRHLVGVDPCYNIIAICRNTTLVTEANIFPFISNNALLYNIILDYRKSFWWGIDKNINLRNIAKYSPATGFPMDICNGSYYQMKTENIDSTYNTALLYGNCHVESVSKIMFIPTASALCVGGGLSTLTSDEYLMSYCDLTSLLPSIPFNSIYLNASNDSSEHTSCDTQVNRYIEGWLNISQTVLGPKFASEGDTYSVNDLWNVSWSTSDSSIATISSSGAIHIVSPGFVTITASGISGGSTVSISKRIMTGIPAYLIAAENISLFQTRYRLSANCSNPEIASFLPYTSIIYDWGVKVGNGPISWNENQPLNWDLTFTDEVNSETVYFKARNALYTSSISSIVLRPRPIISNPLLLINDGGEILGAEGSFEMPLSRSENTSPRKIRCVLDDKYEFEFDYVPNSFDICKRAITNESFRTLLMTAKPWGDKEFLIIKMLVVDEDSGERQETALKLKYTDQL